MKKIMLIFLVIYGFAQLGYAQPSKFPPPNDLGKDKSLVAFVNQLKAAVQKKDKAFLLSVLDEDIMNGFGGDGGIAEFKEYWHWPKDTISVWHHLQHILDIGGGFTAQEAGTGEYSFVFPYIYNLDTGDDDVFTAGVITGKNVNFRDKPDLSAKVITQLTYDVVQFSDETRGKNAVGDPEWYLVETSSHKKGWVFWKYIYSPIGYRLFLYKNKQGKWKISAFLAGD